MKLPKEEYSTFFIPLSLKKLASAGGLAWSELATETMLIINGSTNNNITVSGERVEKGIKFFITIDLMVTRFI